MSLSKHLHTVNYISELVHEKNVLKKQINLIKDNNYRAIILLTEIMQTIEVDDPTFNDLSVVIDLIKGDS